MADDWENLAERLQEEEKDNILIGKVDCTKEELGKPLCKDFGVTGSPTLLYGDVVDLKEYEGGREYEDLKGFVDKKLNKPRCGVTRLKLCEPTKRKQLEDFIHIGLKNLEKRISSKEKEMEELDEEMQEFTLHLREKYRLAMREKEKKKQQIQDSDLKLLKSILSSSE
jgi:hypothetical protein